MEYLQTMWHQIQGVKITDILDILIVAFLIYKFLPLLKSTGTTRVAGVVVSVLVIAWLTDLLKLHALSWVLNQFLSVGLIAVVVLFQPELRRMIDHLGNMKWKKFFGHQKPEQEIAPVIAQTVSACEAMSKEKVGALIVFERDNHLDEYFKSGTKIDGEVSEQLIRNIFFPKAALHDGAMIVRAGRVAAAACVLPLSESRRLSAELGTRHRAAVGMSEVSDAVVVVVSEETGAISVAVGGMLKRHLAAQTLEKLLLQELSPNDVTTKEEDLVVKLRQKLQKKDKEEDSNHEK